MNLHFSFIRQYFSLEDPGAIALPFTSSGVKKRIVMINKIKSARVAVAWFFFVLPLGAVLLLAFRSNNMQESLFTGGHGDTLVWKIAGKKMYQHPVYLLNGKPSDKKTIDEYTLANKITQLQFSPDEARAKTYGPQYDGIMNFQTGNKEEGSIFPPASATGKAADGKDRSNSILYTNMPNVLKVDVKEVPFGQLEARISDGTVVKGKDCFLLQPVTPGYNVEVVLYAVEGGGLKKLDTRTYRTVSGDMQPAGK